MRSTNSKPAPAPAPVPSIVAPACRLVCIHSWVQEPEGTLHELLPVVALTTNPDDPSAFDALCLFDGALIEARHIPGANGAVRLAACPDWPSEEDPERLAEDVAETMRQAEENDARQYPPPGKMASVKRVARRQLAFA